MNLSLRSLFAAVALVATPVALQAASEKCASESAGCCAAKTAGCPTDAKKSDCCAAKTQHVSLKIKNADGSGLQKTLASVKGVGSAETCSESKFTTIAFNKDQVKQAKIRAALKKAGYEIEAQRVTLAVQGMSCGSCADKISAALSKVKGVADAKVCSESKTATIDFDPAKSSADKLIAAIKGAGFKASESLN